MGDPYQDKSIQQLIDLTKGGLFSQPDLYAAFCLGWRFKYGEGTAPNQHQAIRWFRFAADKGYSFAQGVLGNCYSLGEGVPQDLFEAARWFRLAADQGNAAAQYSLGRCYRNGEGVPKDLAEATRWFGLAADQGNADAQYMQACLCYNGEGVPKDLAEAIRWLRLAADQDDMEAQYNLGNCYRNGEGVPKDLAEATRWYRLAADQGDQDSIAELEKLDRRQDNSSRVSVTENEHYVETFLRDAFSELVGLETVQDEIRRQANYLQIQKVRVDQGLRVSKPPSRHMVFLGPPGTGKTTVARIIAGLYNQLGLLETDSVVETDRAGLCAAYIGQTAIKTTSVIDSALGGVLFIDEAYTLARGDDQDFGREAIDTLLKLMEDNRDNLVVIVAGYETEMESFLESNPGLASRFNRHLRFPNYTPDQLLEIFNQHMISHEYTLENGIIAGLEEVFTREIQSQRERFGNARYVRNLVERILEAQADRLTNTRQTARSYLQSITVSDVEAALGEQLPKSTGASESYEAVLFRLNQMAGLMRVKEQVARLGDFVRMQRARAQAGMKTATGFSQHLVFMGNPGTGKTTVARIIADLYFALGVIPTNRLVEVDRSSLVAGFIGQTAIKTQEVIQRAVGGVLFIDEAYSLARSDDSFGNDFGLEAVETLLKAMEDYRDNLVVIVAGYTDKMQSFLDSNPGLRSRFTRHIEFDDYAPDELIQIFEQYCHDGEYEPSKVAVMFIKRWIEQRFEGNAVDGNGRFVRNFYERCVEEQAGRVANLASPAPTDLKALDLKDVVAASKAF
jgi:SpoVK/Ycf46/Vps4 family AAA+-type ATPase